MAAQDLLSVSVLKYLDHDLKLKVYRNPAESERCNVRVGSVTGRAWSGYCFYGVEVMVVDV